MIKKEFTFLNVSWTIDNLLCNLRRHAQITLLTTFMIIMYCYVFKYWYPLDVVDTVFIKTIIHWLPLYVLKSYSCLTLKLLLIKMSWSNLPFSIYNQQLFFTLVIPSSLYINNDDNNCTKVPTLKNIFEFFNGCGKDGNQLRLKISDRWHNGRRLNCNIKKCP
jgi:hypothetical protein